MEIVENKAPSTLGRGNLKMQQKPVILDLQFSTLRNTRAGKSCDYRDYRECFPST